MMGIFDFGTNKPPSHTSESTDMSSHNEFVIGTCPCCGTTVKIPDTIPKYKCTVCQSTVMLSHPSPPNMATDSLMTGLNYSRFKEIVRKCDSSKTSGMSNHDIYKPVEKCVEALFGSISTLNNSFNHPQHLYPTTEYVNYKDVESTFKLLISLPTIRPYFKLLLAANNLLRRPPIEMTNMNNIRWLLILFEIPTLSDCLYYERATHHQHKRGRFQTPEIKSLSYEILKRVIGYLCHLNPEALNHFSSCLKSRSKGNFANKIQLINLYITFHLTRIINRNLSGSGSKGLEMNSSPTLDEYNHSSKLNPTSNRSEGAVPRSSQSSRTWVQLPISLQNGFNNWGDWRRVLSISSSSEYQKSPEIKLKLSDYGNDWHLKSAARLMSIFFVANKTMNLPIYSFYNCLVDYIQVKQDFEAWENNFKKAHPKNPHHLLHELVQNGLPGFNTTGSGLNRSKPSITFCQYPFLLSLGAKISILEYEARKTMERKAEEAFIHALDKRKIIDVNLRFVIRRDHITADSLSCIRRSQNDLKKALRIEFVGEPGIDVGGLKKEWFLLLTNDLFNSQETGMFHFNDESHLCWFAPMPLERNDELYYMLGVVLGLAIYNSTILDLRFPSALYKKLLNKKVTLEDYIELFPATGEGLRKLLAYKDADFEDLGLTFETEFKDFFGKVISRQLVLNGDKIPVTYSNRRDYVNKWVDFYLNKVIESQFRSFYRGFHLVIGGNALSLFAPKEIEMLICGYNNEAKIETASLQAVTKYNGWNSLAEAVESDIVKWFWQWFETMDTVKQRQFLRFVTGSDRIPATGVSTMSFKITRMRSSFFQSVKKLPIAHTCFNEMCLYEYDSREEMVHKLNMSISESEGFGLK